MCQCHAPFVVVDDDGLHIAFVIGTSGGITDMADYNVALSQRLQPVRCKHIVYQTHIPVGGKNAVVVDNDAGTFLPTVLQRKQTIIGQISHVCGTGRKNAEDTTLFVNVVFFMAGIFRSHHVLPAFS